MSTRYLLVIAPLAAAIAGCTLDSPAQPLAPATDHPSLFEAVAANAGAFTASDVSVALLDPGTVRAPGGLLLLRGVRAQFRMDATDPRMTGFGVVVANGNLDAQTGEGPVWGELDIESDQSDAWSGHWTGHRRRNGSVWTAELDFHLDGRGGGGEKLIAMGTETVTTYTVSPAFYTGAVEGTIRQAGN